MSNQPQWLQISALCDAQNRSAVEDVLLEHGALSITLMDAEDQPILEPLPGETPLWERSWVTGLFDARQLSSDARAALERALARLVTDYRWQDLPDQDWVRAWMADFKPMAFGQRLWIYPHESDVPEQDRVVVRLDPGLAFGTGTHPTTAMCLHWLDGHTDLAQKTVLDYGCGSGILAIAALKLGAQQVWATDIDPQALTASQDNAKSNGVADGLRLCQPAECQQAVDVVMANILAQPLHDLAEAITALTQPGGTIVMTGILPEQADQVRERYESLGCALRDQRQQDGWCLLEMCRCD